MGKHKDTHIQSSSRRKESKEKKLRKEERGSRKVRKLRHNSSYSVSSSGSSEDEISNKSKEEALGRKRKREKCNGGRERSDSKRKRREKSFSSLDEESSSSESDSIAKTTELAVTALDMAVKIVKQFPEIAAELEQVNNYCIVKFSSSIDKLVYFYFVRSQATNDADVSTKKILSQPPFSHSRKRSNYISGFTGSAQSPASPARHAGFLGGTGSTWTVPHWVKNKVELLSKEVKIRR